MTNGAAAERSLASLLQTHIMFVWPVPRSVCANS